MLVVASGLVESADKKCDTITDRFRGDLADGHDIGGDDVAKMRKRGALIRDLYTHVKGLPAPKSKAKRAELTTWLHKLDAYADELYTMHNTFQNAKPGMDLLLAMIAADARIKSKEAGTAAKAFGFHSCADVKRWEYLPPD
ncbi:Lipoprotein OS=Streptomyces antimycoticus OX=68175 GN=SANT12839_065290 PE=4 SV=1 [Streptomyces antimycoticus]